MEKKGKRGTFLLACTYFMVRPPTPQGRRKSPETRRLGPFPHPLDLPPTLWVVWPTPEGERKKRISCKREKKEKEKRD